MLPGGLAGLEPRGGAGDRGAAIRIRRRWGCRHVRVLSVQRVLGAWARSASAHVVPMHASSVTVTGKHDYYDFRGYHPTRPLPHPRRTCWRCHHKGSTCTSCGVSCRIGGLSTTGRRLGGWRRSQGGRPRVDSPTSTCCRKRGTGSTSTTRTASCASCTTPWRLLPRSTDAAAVAGRCTTGW